MTVPSPLQRLSRLRGRYALRCAPRGKLLQAEYLSGWSARPARLRLRSCRDYRPGLFFGILAALFAILDLAAEYCSDSGLHGGGPLRLSHVPLAVLATGLGILSALSLCISFILETQLRYHNELHSLIRRNSGLSRKPEDLREKGSQARGQAPLARVYARAPRARSRV